MVCHPLFHELVLLALLWQLVISYWTWKQSQAPQHPLPQRTTRPSKVPKPFAGLTKKLHYPSFLVSLHVFSNSSSMEPDEAARYRASASPPG
jgi:hypothetical protein